MPVRERAGRVFFPGPDVQGIERIEPEAIRLVKEMEELPHELRRVTGIVFVPGSGVEQEVSANQLEFAIGLRLIDDDLWLRRVEHAGLHQVHVDEVHTHGAEVWAADAAEPEVIARGFRRVEVLKARSGLANSFNQSACLVFLFLRLRDRR